MIQQIKKTREYLDYLERHYNNVRRAWSLINKKCKGFGFRFMTDDFVWHSIDLDVKHHDQSKLSAAEFVQYRKYLYPTESELENKEHHKAAFNEAWEHHKEKNIHHWENWTTKISSDYFYTDACLVMMLVDWVAMGFEEGFDDARTYYEKNNKKIKLEDWAVKLMYRIFNCVYGPVKSKK